MEILRNSVIFRRSTNFTLTLRGITSIFELQFAELRKYENMERRNFMYKNLLTVMKVKKVTAVQLAGLLECRQATISDKLNGLVSCGFYFDEAAKIKKVFFPEYDYDYLFAREKVV